MNKVRTNVSKYLNWQLNSNVDILTQFEKKPADQYGTPFMPDTDGAIGPPSSNIYDHLPPTDDELTGMRI